MDDSISTPPDAPSNNGASDSDHFDASINNDLLNESTDDSAAFAEPIKENGTENADAQVQVWPVSVELKTTQQHFLQWLTKKLNEMQLLGWPGPLGGLTIGKLQLREYLGGIELSSDKEPTLILSLSEPSPSRLKVLLSPGPRPYRRIIYALLLQFMVGDYPEAMGIIEKGISSNWGELLWPEANKLNKWLLSSASNPAIENANSSLDDRENSKTTDAQRIKVDNKGLIRQCLLPGTAQHFRGTMERLSYRD